MEIDKFIEQFKQAFGEKQPLPIAIWYSTEPITETPKLGGCYFKHLHEIRNGAVVSLTEDNIGCGGGKFYSGYSDMPQFVPKFVSEKEHYKQTPELVIDAVDAIDVRRKDGKYLNFSRIDNLTSFDAVEALLFLATADVLSGLSAWAFYDRNESDTVSSLFGSGCSSVVTQVINENSQGGYRSFIGFLDPSVRPHIERNELAFVTPMSRFRVMYDTMLHSCLFDTNAWGKVLERINS